MKKGLKLFVILATTILSTFGFSGEALFASVNATYVEGPITLNTVWTLVDSPFVVSEDVTVYPDVTLTIEPEVEVRFGGDFSLIVEGRLVAEGTKDRMITFTSNKYVPEVGAWGTIRFNTVQSSSLIYCNIRYGTNGIIIEDGFLDIQNSLVNLNSENGIHVVNGNVEAKHNEIVNNTGSGIRIAGGNQITIQDNTVESNGDGITLTGNLTSEINLRQNRISSNKGSGILLEANTYVDTIILDNTLSANSYGFYVSSNSSTYITHNYISNNTVGILYEEGNHTAYYNDIFGNGMGMDVARVRVVNATHNYWGDRSGPYHESLNPRGRGNPVGGDGVNLDFIFFLTATIDYDNIDPTATVWADKTLVAPNQNVTFIGTDSHDEGRVDQYFYDFGDGVNSGWTTLSLFTYSYSSTGVYNAKLTVMDDFGSKSPTSAMMVNVQDLTPLETSVTLSNYTIGYNEQVLATVYVSNGISAVENAAVSLYSVIGGSFTLPLGSTNSSGYFTTTFTSPNVTEITSVRIVARASETGYVDGSDYKYLKVLPPLLVQVTSKPATIESEETATVTVHVRVGFEGPVADALLMLTVDHGNLSETLGVTDANGNATFLFTAPQTLNGIDVTIAATAVKIGYAEGLGRGTIIVEPKTLVVEVTSSPAIVFSEATSTITAHVTYDSAPIVNATVTVLSDSGGNFTATTEITDSKGNAEFVFTAPQTTAMLNATITVTAAKSRYVNREEQITVSIIPKTLAVQVTAEPDFAVSEAKVNVTVRVTHAMVPVPDANVTVTSDEGYFSANATLTNVHGDAVFMFTAPQVNSTHNITIIAQASKIGHIDGGSLSNLTVSPGNLQVNVKPSSSIIGSAKSTIVAVYVTCNGTPIRDVSVMIFADHGSFLLSTGMTDSEGHGEFVFNASRTTSQLTVTIVVNATRIGYVTDEEQTTITVIPEAVAGEEGWPMMTILLISIPIVIAVIIVVLLKLKVITLSLEEESK